MRAVETIAWDDTSGEIILIDQTRLPEIFRLVRCRTVDRLVKAIKRLEVRGAPALGIAGAYGVLLATRRIHERDHAVFIERVRKEAEKIRGARPTAVNLSLGADVVIDAIGQAGSVSEAREKAFDAAKALADADARSCHELGRHGARLLPDRCTVLTHCNAGALACREWGTALGVIRSAVESGKSVSVLACETRPLLQGARLTAWELQRDEIPVTVIPDSEAAFLMQQGRVDLVIVGADRITPDAVFNKVGTYMHAVCAHHHGVPFYVAAPASTFDPGHAAEEITIEERDRSEVACWGGITTVPEGVEVINFAFDQTPHDLLTAFITDIGVFPPPPDWSAIQAAQGKILPGRRG
ncbi:MAG: S-methyl-5-thioribose-1-phosphate isomerase [Methanolinea sp.]|nr:S-methyl-5-thioribose-1-phosphate isomerase [Methanolinea sp.]